MAVTLARETVQAIWEEAQPLAYAHHLEVGPLPHSDFKPNSKRWDVLESIGMLRVYTARNEWSELVGYGLMVLDPCQDIYDGITWAQQAMFYLMPSFRNGFTVLRFLKYQDLSLTEVDGVGVIYRHAPHTTQYGALLLHSGYKLNDRGYILDARRAA